MYEILIERAAEKELNKLHPPIFDKVAESILSLSETPRPDGCRKLHGIENSWRIRVGDYRIVYSIEDKEQLIKIERIRHRKDVYK